MNKRYVMKGQPGSPTIEAFRYGIHAQPQWFWDAINRGEITREEGKELVACTIHGQDGAESQVANQGDYVVRSVTGQIYASPQDDFEEIYKVEKDAKS